MAVVIMTVTRGGVNGCRWRCQCGGDGGGRWGLYCKCRGVMIIVQLWDQRPATARAKRMNEHPYKSNGGSPLHRVAGGGGGVGYTGSQRA